MTNIPYVTLKADQVKDLVKLYLEVLDEHYDTAAEEALKYISGSLKKIWFGLAARDWDEDEIEGLIQLHIDLARKQHRRELEKLKNRAEWCCEPSGWNKIDLSAWELVLLEESPYDRSKESLRYFKRVVDQLASHIES